MEDALEGAILKGVQDSIKESVGSSWCEEHCSFPKVTVKGHDIDSLSMTVTGCCDELIDHVKQKLK